MCGISLTHDTIIIAQLYFLLSHWLFISCGNIKVSLGTYKNSVWPYSFSARPWVIDNPDIISNHKYSFHRSQSKFQTEILFPFRAGTCLDWKPAIRGDLRDGRYLYSSTFCFSSGPFSYWLWVFSSSPHPPGSYPLRGRDPRWPHTRNIHRCPPCHAQERKHSPGRTTKVEIQPTSPPLDFPGMSRLPNHYTPQPWRSRFKQYE